MARRASKRKRVYLIDAMSYIFRAYHARTPQPFTSPSGEPTQAVFLFNNMLRKLLREHAPDYVAVAFESGGPTVRDEIFEDYKAQRPSAPDDLVAQIEPIKKLCQALRLKLLQHEGYEADDVIATLAEQARGKGLDVVVVTSDKDMLQLVRTGKGATVQVFSPTREKFLDEAAVEEYFGVPPKKVVEVVALMGDAVDNIPGAKGIGEKGARDLITRFGSADAAMKRADEVKQKKYREALQQQQDQIRLSRQLATLHADLPIPFDLKSLQLQEPDTEQLVALYTEMGFTSLLKEHLPAAVASPKDVEYQDLENPAQLKQFLSAMGQQPLAVWCETSGDSPADLKLTALAFSAQPGAATVAPLGNEREAWLETARTFLEDEHKAKIIHDSKTATLALAAEEMELRGPIDDTALYSYLLQPTTAKHRLEDVAARRLNRPLSGSVAEKADTVQRLAEPLRAEVKHQKLQPVYEHIERPLAPVLARMERTGVRLDPAALEELSAASEKEIGKLTRRIYKLAGVEFNLNSPKQLGEVLYEKLQLPMPRKRGKGKVASTAADVLEELSPQHEMPGLVLEYRELTKLKSTYIDALPAKIHPGTGRLHTSFHQAGTATGRLSSSDPNLQNIPIRGELGTKIRAAFVAEPGWALLAGDYSQIELRVLAHMADDAVLVEAFRRGEDVHARTAQEVLGVLPLEQTSEHRRVAKMINFGIVYGLTAFGLGTRLGIETREAQGYIDAYFERYAGVKKFRESLLRQVRNNGVARTLFGRIRPIPEINSQNAMQRNFAERTALNSPLQGTAADIIKLAMIHLDGRLREEGLQTRMILQVHDELLFEVPEGEVERAQALVKAAMEMVEFPPGKAYALKVPLVVELGLGPHWAAVK